MADGGQDFDLGQVVGSDGANGNGVASVTLISTSGKVKTYRMLFTDGTYVDYQVTDGSDASVTIVTSWNSTTSNSKVPSEKLTKSSLDSKIDKSQTAGLVKNDGSIDTNNYLTSSSASSTYQPLLVSGTNIKTVNNNSLLGSGNITIESGSNVDIVTAWEQTLSDAKVPSEKLTKNSLDNKVDKEAGKGLFSGSYTDLSNKPSIPSSSSDLSDGSDLIKKSNTTGLIKNDGTIDSTSYSTFSGSYADLSNKPSIPSSSSDLSDGSSLVKTSSTTGLLKNDGSVDTNSYLTTSSASSTYQTKLVSGTSIKTINNESLLGSGNISVGGSSVDIVTAWESTPSDSKVPSEKLAKNSLDGKLDNALSSTVVSIASNDDILITDYSDSNKIKRVANILATQVKDGTAHSNIGSSANDTQATINTDINTALGNKVSKSQTSGLLKNDGSVDTSAYITSSAISGMLTTSDVVDNLTSTSSTAPLSAKQGKVLNDLIGQAITYINQ